ncbi:MAG: right-handed parallel beta-helix repeat-containing protein [Microbacteriaceae bacterium]|nr:right-handed parallel beta-helix repeat-containing protein [Microbacteriaceae bacterium]
MTTALGNAKPGDVISLGIGTFTGNFVAETSGTASKPIFLCGSSESVLDGADNSAGYVFHLSRASYWNLVGFSVTNGQKGIVADATVGSIIRNLQVYQIGDEAIHLRTFSTDNLVNHNIVHDTGLLKPKFGEGIYIGTAQKNWCALSNCEPDKSDRNTISDNTIYATTAESIDIKEGTTSGIVTGNVFDGSKIDPAGASAWMNVKGNDWIISNNTGVNSPKDGFQTHEILKGWGTRNVFRDNSATVNGSGFGYALTPVLANVVTCSNVALSAGQGKTNVRCSAN